MPNDGWDPFDGERSEGWAQNDEAREVAADRRANTIECSNNVDGICGGNRDRCGARNQALVILYVIDVMWLVSKL